MFVQHAPVTGQTARVAVARPHLAAAVRLVHLRHDRLGGEALGGGEVVHAAQRRRLPRPLLEVGGPLRERHEAFAVGVQALILALQLHARFLPAPHLHLGCGGHARPLPLRH